MRRSIVWRLPLRQGFPALTKLKGRMWQKWFGCWLELSFLHPLVVVLGVVCSHLVCSSAHLVVISLHKVISELVHIADLWAEVSIVFCNADFYADFKASADENYCGLIGSADYMTVNCHSSFYNMANNEMSMHRVIQTWRTSKKENDPPPHKVSWRCYFKIANWWMPFWLHKKKSRL